MVDRLISGVLAAALTPLTDDLAPDREAFLEHCRRLLAEGCDALAILGTTGEANSLPVDERAAVIGWVSERLPRERLLVGTGSCAVADAIRLTRACLAGGVRCVLVLPPFYYKPLTDDGAYGFFARLIDRVGDDRLRLYLYNFPSLTGYAVGAELVRRLIDRYGPVVAGMKDSSGDWPSMRDMQRRFPGLDLFAGSETFLLPLLNEGGAGCISATANVTAPLCQAVYSAWRAGDWAAAEAAQTRATAARRCIEAFPVIPALKSLLEQRTGKPLWRNVLPPFQPLDAESARELRRRLDDAGGV